MATPENHSSFADKLRNIQIKTSQGLTHTRLRDDIPLKEGSPDAQVDDATLKFMGVKDMRIFHSEADLTAYPEQEVLIEEILNVSRGAEKADTKEDANIIFVPGSSERKLPGAWNFKKQFTKGTAGIMAIMPPRRDDRDEISTDELWEGLSFSFAPYAVYITQNRQGEVIKVTPGSMEGAYSPTDVTKGYQEAADRIQFIGATEKVTHNEIEHSSAKREQVVTKEALEIATTCRLMREWGMMPHLDLSSHVADDNRLRQIALMINSTGLSTGNASAWIKEDQELLITASGVDKGNLNPSSQIVRMNGFTNAFDGVVLTAPEGEKPLKASVEAFDNLLNQYVSLGIESGDITTADIREIIAFAKDEERIQAALIHHDPAYVRQIHFHAHPTVWDPSKVTVVEPSTNLVPYGDANSSCGTRPLAYYTAEMIARGILEDPGKIVIAKLPKHGSQIFSPHDMETTLKALDPTRLVPTVVFEPVKMEKK